MVNARSHQRIPNPRKAQTLKIAFVDCGEIRHAMGQERARQADIADAATRKPGHGGILSYCPHHFGILRQGPMCIDPKGSGR